MAVFPCTYFLIGTKYPQSGHRIQFGNSYTFATPPVAPDQRIFTLDLSGIQYFVTSGGAIDKTIHPERNAAVLDQFYLDHKLYLTFDFNHPVYGMLKCKFNTPLGIPRGIPGGDGVLESFSLELIEIP